MFHRHSSSSDFGFVQSNATCVAVAGNEFPVALVAGLVSVAVVLAAGLAAVSVHMKRKLELQARETARLEEEKELRVQNRVKQGLETVRTLRHPMCVVRQDTFLGTPNEDLFKNHEGMRDRAGLRFLDVLDDIGTFASTGYAIVFYSYQWSAALEWCKAPGGSGVH